MHVWRNHRASLGMIGLALTAGAGLFLFDAYELSRPRTTEARLLSAKEYSRAVRSCTIPGPRTRAFVARIPSGPPARRLAALYRALDREWHDQEKSNARGGDPLPQIDDVIAGGFVGDGDDWAIALAGAAEAMLGIAWRINITNPSTDEPVQGYPELFVCNPNEDAGPTLRALAAALGAMPSTTVDETGVWVALARGLQPTTRARVKYVLYSDGRIKEE